MRRTEKRTRQYEVEVEVVCDRCGASAGNEDRLPKPKGQENRNSGEVEIVAKVYDSWPEGWFGSRWDVDLCTRCFVDWLVPLFAEHGVVVRERELD